METGYPLSHQRIEIGDASNRQENDAWSLKARGYGDIIPVLPGMGYGQVYNDPTAGEGRILRYIHTTPEQDEYAKKILRRMESTSLKDPKAYPYFFGPYDCRWYSDLMFDVFKKMFSETNNKTKSCNTGNKSKKGSN